MKKIGIVGSRRRNTMNDLNILRAKLLVVMDEGDWLVSGGCPPGAVNMAEGFAKEYGMSITIHYPDWKKYGKAAVFVRDSKIAEDCDVLIALPHEDRKGGTEDTIKRAEKLGKQVVIV